MSISAAIDADRLWSRLMQLARIGAREDGGIDRQALCAGEIDAWHLVLGWAADAGFEPATDAAGNLFLTLAGRDRHAAPVLAGSHLDTQPAGGAFDGAYGVLAALEAATVMARAAPPARDLVVVAWMNEEGSRFAPGMMGSGAFAGCRDLTEIRAVRDRDGQSAGKALDALHAAFPQLPRRPLGFPIAAYLETHIEQDVVLERAACPIGIVTGIQGKKTFALTLVGTAGHAGTVAMAERRDALAAFGRVLTSLHTEIGGHDASVKLTIGRLDVEPNAPSIIPARVTASLDLRHPDNAVLDALGARVAALVAAAAVPCMSEVHILVNAPGNGFDEGLQDRIAAAAAHHGFPARRLLSAAGHDARYMAPLCPSGMIFIPCRDGISHAPTEWAEPAHVAAGATVLLDVLRQLAT